MSWLKRFFGFAGKATPPDQPMSPPDQQVSQSTEVGKITFSENGDGTLTDAAEGLMWQADDDGTKRDWDAAVAYCENLSLAGYNDWRLPSLNEFESIAIAAREAGITVNTTFSRSGDGDYWSATPGPQSNVACVALGETMFRTNKYFVRAVRSC